MIRLEVDVRLTSVALARSDTVSGAIVLPKTPRLQEVERRYDDGHVDEYDEHEPG